MNLYRKFFFFNFLVFIIPAVHAQDVRQINCRNAFFAEYALEGPEYSINYDRIFAHTPKLEYSFRLGFSVLKDKIAFPIGAGIITGRKEHHVEFSMTITPLINKVELTNGTGSDNDAFIYLFPGAGYRYQKPSGGIFLRVLAGPAIILDPAESDFWNMDPKVRFSFSLGAGVSFGK
jgi:hypothetical protein